MAKKAKATKTPKESKTQIQKHSKPKDTGLTIANDPILQQVMQSIEKKHGKGIVTTISGEVALQKQKSQLPSGSVGLDIQLGPLFRFDNGSWQTGYGGGRIIEVYGPEGVGKTTMTLLAIANAQKQGKTCVFIDAEHNLDVNYAASLGVNLSTLLLSQPANGEQALQIAEELIRSRRVHLVVIDSVAALVPKSELEGDMGDSSVGVQAKLMSQALRKFATLLGSEIDCNVYFTNQIREKIGVMFGSPETRPGGRALKFFASYIIDVRRAELIKDDIGNPVGHKMKLKLIKNKTGRPFQEHSVDLIWGYGIDNHAELYDLCVLHKLFEMSGSHCKFKGDYIGNGRAAVIGTLRGNLPLCYTLYDTLLTQILANRGYHTNLTKIEGWIAPIDTPPMMPQVEMFAPLNKESPFVGAQPLLADATETTHEDDDDDVDFETPGAVFDPDTQTVIKPNSPPTSENPPV